MPIPSRFCLAAWSLLLLAPVAQADPAAGYHLAATWNIGGDGGWDYLTLDPGAHRLYVARQNRVQVIDTTSGTLIGEVPGLDRAHGVALVPDLGLGFATSGNANAVVVFDLKSLQPHGGAIPVGKKPDAIIYEPFTKSIYVCEGDAHCACLIDPATGKVTRTIPLGGAPEFPVSDGKGKVFQNLEDMSEIVVVDLAKGAVVQTWPLAPGQGPTGLSMDPAAGLLFAGCGNKLLEVVSTDTGKIVASLPIGGHVDATAFDPGTNMAFSSNGEGTLTAIDAKTAQVIGNIPTQPSARTMALDPTTHDIYLAAAQFEPLPPNAPPHTRPKVLPNTFVILKFSR